MKKFLSMVILFLVFLPLAAQEKEEETLFSGKVDYGWSIGSYAGLSIFNDQITIMDGFRVEWIINKNWFVGWQSYESLGSDLDAPISSEEEEISMDIKYRGLMVGRMFKSEKLIHWGLEGLVGWGSVDYHLKNGDRDWKEDYFFAAQPSVFAEVNVVTWFRVRGSAGYRFVQGVTMEGLDNYDLWGPVGGFTFRFGRF